ncbi:mitochondrial fission ELM1 family protein [Rhodobium gokarnense]|uniref:Mitochondrial fission protein ELM1 n=1 Tax=Rhodobium gokarnense TaxID=364296 RepID=A0ABT3H5Z6_9HYPH|nr:mitochondrial fission ELM1 family protein [Rhodobium gokarnense]MCW2305774.1 mitochondrial fission protein ELM1 [Rhodobium gokarnense]
MTARILFLSDSRPGHYHQSEGAIRALQRLAPVSVERIQVKSPGWLRGRRQRQLVSLLSFSPALALRLAHGLDLAAIARPDIIVSAGAETMAANALLARHFGCKNIFIGSLREMKEDRFSAVLAIYPSEAVRANHILTLKPPPFEPDDLPAPTRPQGTDLSGLTAALFVGGPSGSHSWGPADWERLDSLVRETGRAGLSWTLTNSRRTPDAASDRLQRLAAEEPSVAGFVDIRAAGAGSAHELFGADILAVTEDSATMLMEAVAARRPVIALVPEHRGKTRDDEAIDALEGARRLVRLPIAEADRARFGDAVHAAEPLADNPLDALAEKLRPVLAL